MPHWVGIGSILGGSQYFKVEKATQTRHKIDFVMNVLGAYAQFDPRIGAIAQRFFDRPWIDARLRPGKSGGAFAHPTVPSAHPYILLNYHGRPRDVLRLRQHSWNW